MLEEGGGGTGPYRSWRGPAGRTSDPCSARFAVAIPMARRLGPAASGLSMAKLVGEILISPARPASLVPHPSAQRTLTSSKKSLSVVVCRFHLRASRK